MRTNKPKQEDQIDRMIFIGHVCLGDFKMEVQLPGKPVLHIDDKDRVCIELPKGWRMDEEKA